MGFTWMDVANVVVPIAATAVAGPVGGIAAGALMGGATGAAKGEGAKGALLRAGLGAGAGAVGAGATGALSKGAAETAKGMAAKKGAEEIGKQFISEGAKMGATGLPSISPAAIQAGGGAMTGAMSSGAPAALQKFADLTAKAQGDEETAAMLKTVKSGSKTLGAVSKAFEGPDKRPLSFADIIGPQHPGYQPQYQYGSGGYHTPSIGFGRYR